VLLPRLRRFFGKVVGLGGTPHGIAGGFVMGMALSLVPLPFAGMLLALGLAPLLRMNVPATYLGTAVVNPLTGAAFYFAELWLGMTVLGRQPPAWSELQDLDPGAWWAMFVDLLLPFGVGAAIMIAAAIAVCYPALFYATRSVQHRRAAKKAGAALIPAPRGSEAEQAEDEHERSAGPR
jgi:hypothetical protein